MMMSALYLDLVQDAIDYIEENLSCELRRNSIARRVGVSEFHFHRIFQSALGGSTHNYLLQRRLTNAAHQLLLHNIQFQEIADQNGFSSQQTFSRAFKAFFGLTPGQYRKRGKSSLIERPPIDRKTVQLFIESSIIDPQIIQVPQRTVVGINRLCVFPGNSIDLFRLWSDFMMMVNELTCAGNSPQYVGIYQYKPLDHRYYGVDFYYTAGVVVDSPPKALPDGMITKTIPGGKYVCFTNDNPLLSHLEAYRYIHGTWLPRSHYHRAEQDIPLVFKGNPIDSGFDVCIPIR